MSLFAQVSLLLIVAVAICAVTKLLKLPILLGYVLTGLVLGPSGFGLFIPTEEFEVFSEMGVAILLFIVGLHLSPNEISKFGKKAFTIGLLQVLATFGIVFGAAYLFKFSLVESAFLGIALSFSSTIVSLKILSDKKELEKLYGRISIGILLLQDIFAVLALIVVATASSETTGFVSFAKLLFKGIFLTLSAFLLSRYILPKLSKFFAKSQEYLLLFSLGWGFGLASLAHSLGFSLEIGALIAGVTLSITPYSNEISSKLKPLKDFFGLLFFILLGSRVVFAGLDVYLAPFLIFLVLILLLKPVLIYFLSILFGYSKKVGFQAGLGLAQISEFSMILLLLGSKEGLVEGNLVSLVTLLGVVSISVSAFLSQYSDTLYKKFLKKQEKDIPEDENDPVYSVVLFGCNRAGYDFIKMFSNMDDFLAVDFDPDIVDELNKKGINCMYGDAEDGEFLDLINVERSNIVISTIPDFEANKHMINLIRKENKDTLIMILAYDIDHALNLYKEGASYVILPHFIGGAFAVKMVSEVDFDVDRIHARRNKHIDYLKERKSLGHAHPTWSHN